MYEVMIKRTNTRYKMFLEVAKKNRTKLYRNSLKQEAKESLYVGLEYDIGCIKKS